MRRLTFWVIFAAFGFSSGGQWPVLQGVAWVNMIREYSAVVPFDQAVKMTFSGEYPCAMCQAIAQHQREENLKTFALDKQEKKVLPSGATMKVPVQEGSPQVFFTSEYLFNTRAEVPPTPPPRSA